MTYRWGEWEMLAGGPGPRSCPTCRSSAIMVREGIHEVADNEYEYACGDCGEEWGE